MPDVQLWSGVGTVPWMVAMSTFSVTLIYRVLCLTWILCEHWSGRETGRGSVEKRSWLKVWCT
jgi:hypothetical protein